MKQKVRSIIKRLLFTRKKKKKKLSFIPIRLKEDEQFFLLRRNMLLNVKWSQLQDINL